MDQLQGKTAFITGGSKGIGYGIAKALLDQGMNVAISSRSMASATEAAKSLGREHVLPLEADVRSYASQVNAVEAIKRQFGTLDVLVANAGLGHFGSVESLTLEQWNETIETNLTGAFYSIKATLDLIKASKGYIITISSLAGTNFFAGGAAYNASKFGLTGFTQAVMLDLRQYGIKTTTIMPGSVATYFNNHVPNEADDWKIQIEDLGQMTVDLLKMPARALPSKIEVRPTTPPQR